MLCRTCAPVPLLLRQIRTGGGFQRTGGLRGTGVLVPARPVVALPELPLADLGAGEIDPRDVSLHGGDLLLQAG